MRRHADARGQQLGPRGGDDEALLAPLDAEGEAVERAVRRAVLDLGLRDRGLEVDVPHGGRLQAVDVALRVQVAEGELGQVPAARVDGRVLLAPVDREADPPPEGLEGLLVSRVTRRQRSMKFRRETMRGGSFAFAAVAGASARSGS